MGRPVGAAPVPITALHGKVSDTRVILEHVVRGDIALRSHSGSEGDLRLDVVKPKPIRANRQVEETGVSRPRVPAPNSNGDRPGPMNRNVDEPAAWGGKEVDIPRSLCDSAGEVDLQLTVLGRVAELHPVRLRVVRAGDQVTSRGEEHCGEAQYQNCPMGSAGDFAKEVRTHSRLRAKYRGSPLPLRTTGAQPGRARQP
jgi:hypothetical protein